LAGNHIQALAPQPAQVRVHNSYNHKPAADSKVVAGYKYRHNRHDDGDGGDDRGDARNDGDGDDAPCLLPPLKPSPTTDLWRFLRQRLIINFSFSSVLSMHKVNQLF